MPKWRPGNSRLATSEFAIYVNPYQALAEVFSSKQKGRAEMIESMEDQSMSAPYGDAVNIVDAEDKNMGTPRGGAAVHNKDAEENSMDMPHGAAGNIEDSEAREEVDTHADAGAKPTEAIIPVEKDVVGGGDGGRDSLLAPTTLPALPPHTATPTLPSPHSLPAQPTLPAPPTLPVQSPWQWL